MTHEECFARFKQLVDGYCWTNGRLDDRVSHRADPYRADLFKVFVTAKLAGWVDDQSAPIRFAADPLHGRMASTWQSEGRPESVEEKTESGMRESESPDANAAYWILQDVMYRWGEWNYAWDACSQTLAPQE